MTSAPTIVLAYAFFLCFFFQFCHCSQPPRNDINPFRELWSNLFPNRQPKTEFSEPTCIWKAEPYETTLASTKINVLSYKVSLKLGPESKRLCKDKILGAVISDACRRADHEPLAIGRIEFKNNICAWDVWIPLEDFTVNQPLKNDPAELQCVLQGLQCFAQDNLKLPTQCVSAQPGQVVTKPGFTQESESSTAEESEGTTPEESEGTTPESEGRTPESKGSTPQASENISPQESEGSTEEPKSSNQESD